MDHALEAEDLAHLREYKDIIAMLRVLQWAEAEIGDMNAPRTVALIRKCQASLRAETNVGYRV